MGSARRVWLWFRSQGLRFPCNARAVREALDGIRWVTPTYTKIHQVLTNPVYAGAYVYGKTRHERYVDGGGESANEYADCRGPSGACSSATTTRASSIGTTFEANQARIGTNTRPAPMNPPAR